MSSRFRPSLSFTVFFLFAFVLLMSLGVWQVQRLQWKNDLLANIHDRLNAAPLSRDEALRYPSLAEYRSGSVQGHFRHDQEFFKIDSSLQGESGYQIITPLELDALPGKYILINRGWVPLRLKDPQQRLAGQVSGHVTVRGVFRQPRSPGKIFQWSLKNSPQKNFWYWLDVPAMEKASSITGSFISDVYLEADATPNPGGWPQGGQTRTTIPNNHLQYALTWFTLAGALLVMYVIYGLNNGKKHDSVSKT